ncbi:MAG: hypothetical protein J3K34DRAFT_470258 [Monoraphidium minutum]|nr:MAG: hypothetical protein J3K34DRAFT_470258 [Monoraphidium minutum]
MFKASVDAMLERYWAASPRAVSAAERLFTAPGGFGADQMAWDHLAFRTFSVPGLGIDCLEAALQSFGFSRQGELEIPGRHVTAAWFAPPPLEPGGPPAYEQLPSALVSQVEVDALSPRAQATIRRHTARVPALGAAAAWAGALTGALPWGGPAPSWREYAELMDESEDAAWVLVNGFTPVHLALATHRVRPRPDAPLAAAAGRLQSRGFALNDADPSHIKTSAPAPGGGGVVRTSADGRLLQAATVADVVEFWFEGEREPFLVPGSYLALVERHPLPEFESLPPTALREAHLRQGFDAAACDALFESTALAAKAAAEAAAADAAAAAAAEAVGHLQ